MHFLSEYEDFRVDSATVSYLGLKTSYHTVYRKRRCRCRCRLGGVDLVVFSVSTFSRVGDSTM